MFAIRGLGKPPRFPHYMVLDPIYGSSLWLAYDLCFNFGPANFRAADVLEVDEENSLMRLPTDTVLRLSVPLMADAYNSYAVAMREFTSYGTSTDPEWTWPDYILPSGEKIWSRAGSFPVRIDIDPNLGIWRYQERDSITGQLTVRAYGGTEEWPWLTTWTSILGESGVYACEHEWQLDGAQSFEIIASNSHVSDPRVTTPTWGLKELSLSNTRIRRLEASGNNLTVLALDGTEFLQHLDIRANKLASANLNLQNAGVHSWEIERGESWSTKHSFLLYCDASSQANAEGGLTSHPFLGTGARNSCTDYYNIANNNIATSLYINSYTAPTVLDISFNSITSIAFSQNDSRPAFWYLQNNALTSVDVGTAGALAWNWGAIQVFEAANNRLPSLVFPAPTSEWTRFGWRTSGGYDLVKLDVRNNLLTSLDVSNIDTLITLNVSQNPLTSLTLRNCNTIVFSEPLFSLPPELVGWWGTFEAQTFTSPSYLHSYKHLTGVRDLDISNTSLTQFPASGSSTAALVSIRRLKAHNCPALTNIGGTTTLTQSQTWFNPSTGTTMTNSWFNVGTGGNAPFGGVISNVLSANATTDVYPMRLLYFRNIGSVTNNGVGRLTNLRPFLVGASLQVSSLSSPQYYMARHPDALERDFTGMSSNPDPEQGKYWHSTSGFGATTQAKMYDLQNFLGHLVDLDVENCPALTFINLSGSAFLRRLRVVNCPQAGGRILTNSNTDDWRTYTQWLDHLELDTTNWTQVRLENNWAENVGTLDDYKRFIVRNTPIGSSATNLTTWLTKSRKGVDFRNSQLSQSVVNLIMQRLSSYEYDGFEFGDSNVLDLRQNPFSKTDASYVALKNDLQGQSSSIVSMTHDGFGNATVVLATPLRVSGIIQTAVIAGVTPDRYNGAYALNQTSGTAYPGYWINNTTFVYRLRALVAGDPIPTPAPIFAGATVFIGRGWTVLD